MKSRHIVNYAIGALIAIPIVWLIPEQFRNMTWCIGFACGQWFIVGVAKLEDRHQ